MNRRFLWSFRELLRRKLKMSLERARAYLKSKGYEDRIIIPEQSSATVAEAAAALGCEPGMIAKTL
jgi:prolyl-tRNA editing enzyme YbaK/EbsC (Cys-tRNA(Pro) deacylase)